MDGPVALSVDQFLLLAGASVGGGVVNSVAGGGSLLTFPALLAAGLPAVSANVTNAVAVAPANLSGAAAYRRELTQQRGSARRLILAAALGAATGTALLLVGPDSVFEALVPFLVLAATVLLALQPALSKALRRRGDTGGPRASAVAVYVCSTYGGYFGAGLGIMLLAALGLTLGDELQRLNALKVLLSLVVSAITACSVMLFGPVAWTPALVMIAFTTAGGWIGVSFARRLSERVLRWGIVVFGVVVSVALYLM